MRTPHANLQQYDCTAILLLLGAKEELPGWRGEDDGNGKGKGDKSWKR